MQKLWQCMGGEGSTFWCMPQMNADLDRICADPIQIRLIRGYGSGGAGLSVPRSRLNIDDGSQAGMSSALAARIPISSITLATVRGPLQSQSGRTMSVGW